MPMSPDARGRTAFFLQDRTVLRPHSHRVREEFQLYWKYLADTAGAFENKTTDVSTRRSELGFHQAFRTVLPEQYFYRVFQPDYP